jgi:hypothetical protein
MAQDTSKALCTCLSSAADVGEWVPRPGLVGARVVVAVVGAVGVVGEVVCALVGEVGEVV